MHPLGYNPEPRHRHRDYVNCLPVTLAMAAQSPQKWAATPCANREPPDLKTLAVGRVGIDHESTHGETVVSRRPMGDDPLRAGQQRAHIPALPHLGRGHHCACPGCCDRRTDTTCAVMHYCQIAHLDLLTRVRRAVRAWPMAWPVPSGPLDWTLAVPVAHCSQRSTCILVWPCKSCGTARSLSRWRSTRWCATLAALKRLSDALGSPDAVLPDDAE